MLDPTTIDDMADPDPSASASFAPGVPEAGDVFRSGSVRLSMVPDQADESFDFDSGTKGAPNTFSAGERPTSTH